MEIWSKIEFSVIIAKNRFFENNTFSEFFFISLVKHHIPKLNSGFESYFRKFVFLLNSPKNPF